MPRVGRASSKRPERPDEPLVAASALLLARALEDAAPQGFRVFLEGMGVAPSARVVEWEDYNGGMANET